MTGRTGILLATAFALSLVTGCGRYGPLVRPIPTTPSAPAAEAQAPDPEEPTDETVSPEGGFHEGDDEE